MKRLDKFEMDGLLADGSSCTDCAAPLPKGSVIALRHPEGRSVGFTMCLDCAIVRILKTTADSPLLKGEP